MNSANVGKGTHERSNEKKIGFVQVTTTFVISHTLIQHAESPTLDAPRKASLATVNPICIRTILLHVSAAVLRSPTGYSMLFGAALADLTQGMLSLYESLAR